MIGYINLVSDESVSTWIPPSLAAADRGPSCQEFPPAFHLPIIIFPMIRKLLELPFPGLQMSHPIGTIFEASVLKLD